MEAEFLLREFQSGNSFHSLTTRSFMSLARLRSELLIVVGCHGNTKVSYVVKSFIEGLRWIEIEESKERLVI